MRLRAMICAFLSINACTSNPIENSFSSSGSQSPNRYSVIVNNDRASEIPSVKILENYSVTNIEKSQEEKSNSLLELLSYLHELPRNESLSGVTRKISTTTESVIAILDKLRHEESSSTAGPPGSTEKTSTLSSTESEEIETTITSEDVETTLAPASPNTEPFVMTSLAPEMSSQVTTSSDLIFTTERNETEMFALADTSSIEDSTEMIDLDETAVSETIPTTMQISYSTVSTVFFQSSNSTEIVISTTPTTEAQLNVSQESLGSHNLSTCDSDDDSRCENFISKDIAILAGISVGSIVCLGLIIGAVSIWVCKKSQHKKNVYATMEEDQPKEFTKAGPPIILPDELRQHHGVRYFHRNTDKVTEL